jgi:signal transduction histidine kinase
MRAARKSGGVVHDRSSWTAPLLLLAAVLAPSGCVLWYMNEAVQGQRDAARRRLTEAWRGQLALVRDRLDAYWEKRATELDAAAAGTHASPLFARLVREGASDSAIVLNRDGSLAYPTLPAPPPPERQIVDPAWTEARSLENAPNGMARAASLWGRIADTETDAGLRARAAQSQIRCLMQSGDKAGALRAIDRRFATLAPRAGLTDATGRFIPGDAFLLAAVITRGDARAFPAAAGRLRRTLDDYDLPIPSAQRLFLMHELKAIAPVDLRTFEAERMAAAFLEADRARAGDAVLRLSGLPEVWKLSAKSGRVIALYRTSSVMAAMGSALRSDGGPAGVRFAVVAPGVSAGKADETMGAGGRLPGWQVTLTLDGASAAEDASRRMTAYIWVGCGAIAVMALIAVAAGRVLLRQMRVARLKTDLAATVSHELKTPLSSMRLLVDTLLESDAPDPVRTREYLEMIARENLRLSRLIDNFLTFSRMERDRHKFEFAETAPAEIVRSVEAAVSERFRTGDCRLSVESAEGLPALRADRDALVTVLLNLLDNAYKFTGESKRIALRASGDGGGRIQFSVEDNGIGIAPREQKKIFRRFYQVDRRLSRAAGGCGLGLSIVDFIVRAHGGEVGVRSRPGEGSTFTVSLPAAGLTGAGA